MSMNPGDGGMNVSFFFGGHELSVDDFSRDLAGYVAFQIAYTAATGCADKGDALRMLHGTARQIIRQVKKGVPPS